MLEGIFLEAQNDRHVALRRRMLARQSGNSLLNSREVAIPGLDVIEHDGPLEDEDLLALGRELGAPMPERHPSVQQFVQCGVILNLVTEYRKTADVDRQPFATNPLLLHTESSGSPVAKQPRYIVLMCVDPGPLGADAQTVVVPMEHVAALLSPSVRTTLSLTRYRRNPAGETIAQEQEGRTIFRFRDFGSSELEWAYEGRDARDSDVNDAIRKLLEEMYSPTAAVAIRWRRGMIVTIDNTFVFHGRTEAEPAAGPPRRLKRVRVLDAPEAS